MPYDIVEFLAAHSDTTCVLLVHPDVRVIQQHALEVAASLGVQPLSLGKELSGVLLNEPLQARPRLARTWLFDTVGLRAHDHLVLTDIDLLFEPAWALDPLTLFRSASRSVRLIVAWPGTHTQSVLAYAIPEHNAHRTWLRPGVSIIDLL